MKTPKQIGASLLEQSFSTAEKEKQAKPAGSVFAQVMDSPAFNTAFDAFIAMATRIKELETQNAELVDALKNALVIWAGTPSIIHDRPAGPVVKAARIAIAKADKKKDIK